MLPLGRPNPLNGLATARRTSTDAIPRGEHPYNTRTLAPLRGLPGTRVRPHRPWYDPGFLRARA
jgi:hypothetical protein